MQYLIKNVSKFEKIHANTSQTKDFSMSFSSLKKKNHIQILVWFMRDFK